MIKRFLSWISRPGKLVWNKKNNCYCVVDNSVSPTRYILYYKNRYGIWRFFGIARSIYEVDDDI